MRVSQGHPHPPDQPGHDHGIHHCPGRLSICSHGEIKGGFHEIKEVNEMLNFLLVRLIY